MAESNGGAAEAPWWLRLRRALPLCSRRSYFFSGAQAPLAVPVREAMQEFLELWEEKAWRYEESEWRWLDQAQGLLGRLLRCEPARIVIAESTSHAMNVAAAMVLTRWSHQGRRSGNIVLHEASHPASSYPFLNAVRQGAALELRWPVGTPEQDPVDVLASAIDRDTVAVVTTHVSHLTGERLDVTGLATRFPHRTWVFLLDAAQSAGALSLADELTACDFVAFPAYKWLFGPPGVGFLVCGISWLEDVGPPFAGWASAADVMAMDPRRLELAPAPASFRLGMPNFMGIAGAAAGVRLSLEARHDRVADRIERLTERFLGQLVERGYASPTPLEWRRRAGVTAIDVGDPHVVRRALLDRGYEVGYEASRLRVDLHAFNTEEEVDHLLALLSELAPPRPRPTAQG